MKNSNLLVKESATHAIFYVPSASVIIVLCISKPLHAAPHRSPQGLLGFALSPSFDETGVFYVSYSIAGTSVSAPVRGPSDCTCFGAKVTKTRLQK